MQAPNTIYRLHFSADILPALCRWKTNRTKENYRFSPSKPFRDHRVVCPQTWMIVKRVKLACGNYSAVVIKLSSILIFSFIFSPRQYHFREFRHSDLFINILLWLNWRKIIPLILFLHNWYIRAQSYFQQRKKTAESTYFQHCIPFKTEINLLFLNMLFRLIILNQIRFSQ